jgi:hypothetical protein
VASAKPSPRVSPSATRIVLGDIDDVSEASDLIGATGHPAVPVTPDVSDPSSTEAARDRVTDARGRAGIAAIKRKHHPQNLFHHNANIKPAQAGGRPDNTSDISVLGNHPITPVLLATDLAVGTAGQQTRAAWQVSDIRTEAAELHARGIKVEDNDTPG